MIRKIKEIVYYFSEEAQRKRRHDAMIAYLSQAQDRAHLEQLENQWFKMNGYR